LNHTDVSQAARAPGRESQANPAMANFASETADVGIEIAIRPPAESLSGRERRASMDESVDRTTHLLQEGIEMFLALLTTGDGSNIDVFPARDGLESAQEQIARVEILRLRLNQEKHPVGFHEAFQEERWDDFVPRVQHQVLEVRCAMPNKRTEGFFVVKAFGR